MAKQTTYKSYVFIDKDPIIDEVGGLVKDTGTAWQEIEDGGGPKTATLRNWFRGRTRRPQFATVRAAIRTMGHDIIISAGVRRVSSVDRKRVRQYWDKPKKK